jgi:arginine-tRNA-protein transferase
MEFNDEGIFPGFGTFHMYHRIDGKLVAVGVIDILKSLVNSDYFFYDPANNFLHLGVVGAIMELQYINYLKANHIPTLKYYFLSEIVSTCPKVNYKLHYRPGLITCPTTKQLVSYE